MKNMVINACNIKTTPIDDVFGKSKPIAAVDLALEPSFSAYEDFSYDAVANLLSPDFSATLEAKIESLPAIERLIPRNTEPYTLEWDEEVEVMVKWHKRAKIRKKWLKRYGTKFEPVKFIGEADNICISGARVDFEMRNIRREYTKKQQRRGYIVHGIY